MVYNLGSKQKYLKNVLSEPHPACDKQASNEKRVKSLDFEGGVTLIL